VPVQQLQDEATGLQDDTETKAAIRIKKRTERNTKGIQAPANVVQPTVRISNMICSYDI